MVSVLPERSRPELYSRGTAMHTSISFVRVTWNRYMFDSLQKEGC